MEIDILSLFPECFDGPLQVSMLKRAREKGLLSIRLTDIRDFALDKHRKVDDRPYGGGPGMVMKPEPLVGAIRSVKIETSHLIYLSPRGKVLTADLCQQLAHAQHLILVCGHYEGIDERVMESEVGEEISIGDYVLTNGALPAMVVIDAVARFIPGVLGDQESALDDSFQNGLLEQPHYTRPEIFEGKAVPRVLLEGNHSEISRWRREKALEKTKKTRPDLYRKERVKNGSKD